MARGARPAPTPRRATVAFPAPPRPADPPPSYDSLPDWCTPHDAGAYLQLSKNTIYELLKTGAISSVKYGRQIRIPKTALLPSVKA